MLGAIDLPKGGLCSIPKSVPLLSMFILFSGPSLMLTVVFKIFFSGLPYFYKNGPSDLHCVLGRGKGGGGGAGKHEGQEKVLQSF